MMVVSAFFCAGITILSFFFVTLPRIIVRIRKNAPIHIYIEGK